MGGPRVARCELCRQRHKRCTHLVPQPAMPPRMTSAAPRRQKKSLVVRLPVGVTFTGDKARLVRQALPTPPHPATNLSNLPEGPPILQLSSLNHDATARHAWTSLATDSRLPSSEPRTQSNHAFESRDMEMLDAGASSLQHQGTTTAAYPEILSHGMQVGRDRADSVAMPQRPGPPGPSYTCDLCNKPIRSEVWHSCRVCGNVDFHKACVQEGRRLHHIGFPKHGFMQVAREGQEEDELLGGWPAPVMQEDDPDVFMCDACDQPIDGMRHYCAHCLDLDFCDEHFVAGMKQHQLVEPNHIFDHQHVPKAAEFGTVPGNSGARRSRSRRDDTPFAIESPLKPETTRSNKLFPEDDIDWPTHGKPNGSNNFQTAFLARGAATPTPLPRPERQSGKQARPPSRRRAGKAPAPVSDHDQPAPPQPRASSQHFASITDQLAKSAPSRPVRHRTYPIEQTTREVFAKKWLFHFHSYIRTWSEEANVAHAANGMQILCDFTSDAAANDSMPAHFANVSGVEVATQNRDYHFANPFQAASKARQLNQRSIENWTVFRDRNGMIAGQVVATMGYVQLQEVDALLSRARELGRMDGWRTALPLLGHNTEPL